MSRALGTYGLTGDGLLCGSQKLGAVLSGMEFSGQYGISHDAATVTKNLIFDWATFSDSNGRSSRRRRHLRASGAAPSRGASLCRDRQGVAIRSGGFATRATEHFSALGPARHRSIPPALSRHAAVRRHSSRRRRSHDRRGRSSISARPLCRGGQCLSRARRRRDERRRRPQLDLGDRIRLKGRSFGGEAGRGPRP